MHGLFSQGKIYLVHSIRKRQIDATLGVDGWVGILDRNGTNLNSEGHTRTAMPTRGWSNK